jgi:putative sterol carrier protein
LADVAQVLQEIAGRLNERPEEIRDLDVLYHLRLTGEEGGSYYLGVRDGVAEVIAEPTRAPTAVVTLAREDFDALLERRTSAMALFMSGRVKLEGDIGQALRLEGFLR